MDIKEYTKAMLSLQYLGVLIEDTQQSNIFEPIIYKFSVPEKSEIEIKSANYNTRTSDGLIQITKEALIDIACETFEECDTDLLEDFKKNTSNYMKFYAKVRKGEVWTKELGEKELERIKEQIEYKEV